MLLGRVSSVYCDVRAPWQGFSGFGASLGLGVGVSGLGFGGLNCRFSGSILGAFAVFG